MTRLKLVDEVKGIFTVFGLVAAIFLLIGFVYHPIAYQNYWGPFERASCVSEIDGERATASFDRGGSHFKLRNGSDAEKGVHARNGTGDWKCQRDKDLPSMAN